MYRTVMPVLIERDKKKRAEVRKLIKNIDSIKHEEKEEGLKIKLDAKDVMKFFKTLRKVHRATKIFEENILVCFVSRYDELIGDILRIILEKKPDPLYGDDKKLSLKQILELKTINQIKNQFIDSEVEQVLRKSHSEQIDYLEKRLEMPLRKNLPIWSKFIESTERRNLLVHCGGVVTEQYIKVCKNHGVKFKSDEKCEKGKEITTDKEYLENTFLVFYEFGFKLGQTIFCKIFGDKVSLRLIDSSLIQTGYDLLRYENWFLALKVFEFANELKPAWISDDRSKKIFVINNAIALKNSGNNESGLKLLDQIDWSSASSEFGLAVKVLREEYDEAERLMSLMDGISPINEDAFRDWPLFREFRKTEQFARAFNKIYGKEFDGLPSEEDIKEYIQKND